ncbi:hypothetical protein MASR1M60_09230 [Rhodocyclaceae bacterium]
MRQEARRSFWLALVFSVLIHLGVLTAPGWGLPGLDDEPERMLIEARLAPAPPPRQAAPLSPPLRKSLPASAPALAPASPAATASPDVVPSAPPEPPKLQAPSADAVPPAPTFEPAPALEPVAAPLLVAEMTQYWPRTGRMVFRVTRGEDGLLVGESTHVWQHDGARYRLQSVTETVGLAALFRPVRVEQVSEGGFDAFGLRPHSFETLRDGKRRESILFDGVQGLVFFSNGQSGPLLPGTQDLLALFHQLGAHSAEQRETTLNVATGRKMASFRIVLLGVEPVVTPYGEFGARHYRITGNQSDDTTEIWIDEHSRLPVKIRHRDRKGEVFDQLVTQIELKEAP